MRRRELVVAASVLLSGCSLSRGNADGGDGTGETDASETPGPGSTDATTGIEAPSLAEQGRPPTICEESIRPDGIRAIADPSFGPPSAWPDDPADYRPLTDDQTVVGVTAAGAARAYPLTVLNVHEVVNDTFGGPLLVTYCPICRSGMVASRRVDGTTTRFDVSGLLWKPPRVNTVASELDGRVFSDREEGVSNSGNLVMYDAATGSYWSQMLAAAICGPAEGTRLSIRPSSVATLGEWTDTHPDTEVLLPPSESEIVDPPIG